MHKITLLVFSFSVLIFSLVTIAHLIFFLSSHSYLVHPCRSQDPFSLMSDDTVLDSVINNLALLVLFMMQHSLQAKKSVKRFMKKIGFKVIDRLLYIIGTCVTLQILMFYWQPIPDVILWELPTLDNEILWWIFSSIHVVCWLTMYGTSLIMDISEFLGVKQVYYYIHHWPPPLFFKSECLKRLYSHFRHMTFSALAAVLFLHPIMQLDRLLLTYVFVCYMILGFQVDSQDEAYQRRMLKLKLIELWGY